MKIVANIEVEEFYLGQRDQRGARTCERPISLLDDVRVLICSEDDGIAFDLDELSKAVDILELREPA